MTEEFKVEVQLLENVARAWDRTVQYDLSEAAVSIDTLKFSRIEFGIFQLVWQRYTETAQYIQDRLREGSQSAAEMATALNKVAAVFEQQDQDRASGLKQNDAEMGFRI
ncbi:MULTISPECIES: hypothetical protein [unclassified Nocardia]|uniref:hypothetical protein n=1 Tax=unclassified Nocardia TaxID=2637762 RepID=UPI001CE4524B|nr:MULTISPECIES: hypothetical protein [unclassified Nocardia]